MKQYITFTWMILVLFILTACTSEQGEPVEATRPAATAVPPTLPPATATPMPTATAVPPTATEILVEATNTPQQSPTKPTPVPDTPTPAPAYLPCPENPLPGSSDPSALLRVLYTVNDQYWLWREETGTAESLPIFRENWPLVAPDGQRFAFMRVPHEQERELWVIDRDGRNERKLAALATAETWARYGDQIQGVDLGYWWLGPHTIAYQLRPQLLLGGVSLEAIYLVDVDTGVSQMILPPGEYSAELGLSPDNLYAVALTADFAEVHLIHVADGQVRLNLPADPRTAWAFSPDGRYLLLTLAGGAIILNMADLSQQPIPMPYGRIGVSEGSVMPPLFWVDETAWYGLTPEGKDGFTLWRINVVEGTAIAIGSYPGLALFAAFSPDGRYLAYWLEEGEGRRDLHLVETATGQDVVYDSGRLDLWFEHWQSDATHFIYRYTTNERDLQMGHICQSPVTLDVTLPDHDLQWVSERGFFHLRDLTSDDSGSRGMLYLQLLDGDTILIGELSAPPGSGINWSYFEQP